MIQIAANAESLPLTMLSSVLKRQPVDIMPLFTKNIAKTSISLQSSDHSSLSSSILGNTNEIRVVTTKDYKLAAACLIDAFSKDEVSTYFTNCSDTVGWSTERKWNMHVQIMNAMTYAHVKFGTAHAIGNGNGGTYDAVALWMPPGIEMDSYLAMLKSGVLWKGIKTFRMLSKEGRHRLFKEFFSLLTITKVEVLKERDPLSWYLVYLGTHSRARGRGLARKLVTEVTTQVRFPSLMLTRILILLLGRY